MGHPMFFEPPKVTPGSLDEMLTEAAKLWDGATEQEWIDGASVLISQTIQIYGIQHQPWHEGVFEETTVCDWIESAIRSRAITYKDYVLSIGTAKSLREKAQHRAFVDAGTMEPTETLDSVDV